MIAAEYLHGAYMPELLILALSLIGIATLFYRKKLGLLATWLYLLLSPLLFLLLSEWLLKDHSLINYFGLLCISYLVCIGTNLVLAKKWPTFALLTQVDFLAIAACILAGVLVYSIICILFYAGMGWNL